TWFFSRGKISSNLSQEHSLWVLCCRLSIGIVHVKITDNFSGGTMFVSKSRHWQKWDSRRFGCLPFTKLRIWADLRWAMTPTITMISETATRKEQSQPGSGQRLNC